MALWVHGFCMTLSDSCHNKNKETKTVLLLINSEKTFPVHGNFFEEH